ncbi:hypothetical protein HYU95_04045 [Candidatus Daviesbacteria bacterium]|nr:hypothetical protein [Candidatus Daviesbacteria bacterium]
MVAVGHTAVGVIVGVVAYNSLGHGNLVSGLAIAGAAGIVSHYLTDFIPHGHFFKPDQFRKYIVPVIIFDLLLPIALLLGITYLKNGFSWKMLYIIFGIGGSQLPDVIEGLIFTGMIKAKSLLKLEYNLHIKLHWHGDGSRALLLGLRDIWQLLAVLSALFLIVFN